MEKKILLIAMIALFTAITTSPPLHGSLGFEECSKELATYFPVALMNETLKKFNIPESKWGSITKELVEKDKNIVVEVELRADKMKENPLKKPELRLQAVKLFKEALQDAFANTLRKNGIDDDTQIQAMLQDLQQQKAKRFAACLEKHKKDAETENK